MIPSDSSHEKAAVSLPPVFTAKLAAQTALLAAVLLFLYWRPVADMYYVWVLPGSYYSHGFLIPPISLYFAWAKRHELKAAEVKPMPWLGYALILFSAAEIILGAFLGFAVFVQASLITMIAGIVLTLFGKQHFKLLAFPILFLAFMVPIPSSLTQSIAFTLKLFATSRAVELARLMLLPVVHDGSYVYFRDEYLLVGDVCGGLRSLISMVALGVIMAQVGKARLWAKMATVAIAIPIAVVSNVLRILLLCLVGYFFGVKNATGWFHDLSGLIMFLVAFLLFAATNSLLHRIAPVQSEEKVSS